MRFQKIEPNKYIYAMVILAILMIFSARFFLLDRDLPPWGVINYQPVDEGSYSVLALNMQNYGAINPEETASKYPSYIPPHVRVNIIGNVASYIGLCILGDTYIGARVPYVLFAFVNFLLIFILLMECRKKYGKKTFEELWIIAGIMFYMAMDFTFLMSSRVVEPSSVRLLFVLLTLLAFLKLEGKEKLRFFVCGMLITLSVFGVYVTNVFLYLAMIMVLVYIQASKGWKDCLISLAAFTAGSLLVLAVCEIYYIRLWGVEAITNMLKAVLDFSTVNGYSGATSQKTTFKTIIRFFSANPLLYNMPILFGAFLSLPVILGMLSKKRDLNLLLTLAIPTSFLIQTLFSEDYIVRKFIVIYPLFIIVCFMGYLFRDEIGELRKSFDDKLKSHKRKKIYDVTVAYDSQNAYLWESPIIRRAVIVYTLLAIGLCACGVAFRIMIVDDGTRNDFTITGKLLIVILGLLPILFMSIDMVWAQIKRNTWSSRKWTITILLISSCALSLNMYLDLKYVFLNPTFSEKEAMIKLNKVVGNGYVLGEYENGFTLYNNMKPVLNTYEALSSYMEKSNDLYYFDYYDKYSWDMRYFLDDVLFKDSDYTVIPMEEFKREFQTFGEKKSMALYKVVKKKDAVQHYIQYFEKLKSKKNLTEEEKKFLKKTRIPYTSYYGDYTGDVDVDIYTDIHGNIYGNINACIYGDVYGDVYGNIKGKIMGQVYGTIYGETTKTRSGK